MRFAAIPKAELFARLDAGHAAGATVVTPNARLAHELAREFDRRQAGAGRTVWEAADILPLSAFVERLYEDALTSETAAGLPLLLEPAQARRLWADAIRASRWGDALLAPDAAAEDAARAWELAQAWRIADAARGFPGNDDARAFAEWARAVERRCAADGATDAARLPDVVAPLLGDAALRKPRLLVAYAFDVLAPQQAEFLAACARSGIELRACAPEPRRSAPGRREFASAREELDAAARWARGKAEAGAARIGVVVPDLERRRLEVQRVFAGAMRAEFQLPGQAKRALPFNLSLGAPLAGWPLARAALSILELAAGEIPFEQASRLVRSPFLGGGEAEAARRARLDARLRRNAPARIGLTKLVAEAQGTPMLRARLEAMHAVPRLEAGSPRDWARRFTTLLDAAGFPGRSLDSEAFQVRARLNDTLAELARLERVVARMDARESLGALRSAMQALFQPESPDAPVQVLGVLESAGLAFDALWVAGLTDEAWPLSAAPNPFLPATLQKKAGIPESAPETALARARRLTDAWLGAAPEVVLSHPASDGDRKLIVSPLIAAIPLGEAREAPAPRYRDLIFAARAVETLADGSAPPLATTTPRGGTRILADQSACPFRAFARHRLGAEPLEEAADGLDAKARGSLLHELMRALWAELKGSEGLEGDCAEAIARAAAHAVAAQKLDEPLAGMERKRLAKLARAWLEVERQRPAFEVDEAEKEHVLGIAGLELKGRIDRVDRLAAGGRAVIDYKGGTPKVASWMGGRPEDPQLPLYALNVEDVAAVAFAQLRTGEMRFVGVAREKGVLPMAQQRKDWQALLAGWKNELEALGSAFAAGDARVDPKRLLLTCRYCELQPLCRVHERLGALEGEDADE